MGRDKPDVRITTEQELEQQYGQISSLLQKAFLWRLPAALEQQFCQQFDQRAVRNFPNTINNTLIFAVFLAIAVFVLVGTSNLGVWVYVYATFMTCILTTWLLSKTEIFRRRYQQVLVSIALVPTVVAIVHPTYVPNDELRMLIHQGTVYVILLQFLGLNLRLKYATGEVLVALLLGFSWLLLVDTPVPIEWYMSLSTAFGGLGMGLILAVRDEERQRRVFLHERILQLDNIRIQQLANSLKQMSHHDSLTGLANRRAFNEAFERACRLAYRDGQPLAVVLLDVDFFKRYNDHYGHPAGDKVLAAIGDVLAQQARRPHDMACRFGGEEFLLMLPNTTLADACIIAERTLQAVRELRIPHAQSSCSDFISLSAGISAAVPEPQEGARLIHEADAALYAAKAQGRNRWVAASGDAGPDSPAR